MNPQPFPHDWRSALVLVAHPDDPEYGMAAAVAKWTAAGKTVRYALACRGEAGIAGMPPEQCGPLREAEQRRAAQIVGVDPVDGVEFWDFPDSNIRDIPELRAKIASVIQSDKPDVVLTLFGGPEFAPGFPNQRDHIEFAAAVTAAYDGLADPPRWLFQSALAGTHVETVDDYIEVAVESLTAHDKYLSVLDPQTPVREQARRVVEMATPQVAGQRAAAFTLERGVTA